MVWSIRPQGLSYCFNPVAPQTNLVAGYGIGIVYQRELQEGALISPD